MSLDIPDEPIFALSESDVALLKAEQNLITFALTTHVSPEVRAECEAELAAAKLRGYKRI
jgi:hypothetical protein